MTNDCPHERSERYTSPRSGQFHAVELLGFFSTTTTGRSQPRSFPVLPLSRVTSAHVKAVKTGRAKRVVLTSHGRANSSHVDKRGEEQEKEKGQDNETSRSRDKSVMETSPWPASQSVTRLSPTGREDTRKKKSGVCPIVAKMAAVGSGLPAKRERGGHTKVLRGSIWPDPFSPRMIRQWRS